MEEASARAGEVQFGPVRAVGIKERPRSPFHRVGQFAADDNAGLMESSRVIELIRCDDNGLNVWTNLTESCGKRFAIGKGLIRDDYVDRYITQDCRLSNDWQRVGCRGRTIRGNFVGTPLRKA